MNTSTEDILGGSPARPSSLSPDFDVIGTNGKAAASAPAPPVTLVVADTEVERIEAATRVGMLTECPSAYAEGEDWQTIRADNSFRLLYLDHRQYASISDEQVQTNAQVLSEFWESRRRLLIRGGDRLKARFGEGTIEQAPAQLEKATRMLADAGRRQAYFSELEKRRLQAATELIAPYLKRLLAATENVMKPHALNDVLEEGVRAGFTLPEVENYVMAELVRAGLAPVKTVKQNANPLLATWTLGGKAPVGQLHTKVLGQEVYDLQDAGQLLYEAFIKQDEAALQSLDDDEYLMDVAVGLGENDVKRELKVLLGRKLGKDRKRLTALYLLNPSLPYTPADRAVPFFESAAQLLARAARSAADFAAAEAAFKAGLLHIWLRASASGAVKIALPPDGSPTHCTALVFRQFLHRAAPDFPLWLGAVAINAPSELAAYIRQDENTWKMVSGSLEVGYLSPWLQALGKVAILEQQVGLATTLVGPNVDANSEKGRKLAVQALLQALDPPAATPDFQPDVAELPLTGLSGEELVERTLTLTNPTGGYQRVLLVLEPALEGVTLSATELFFDQRAPGQQLTVKVTGNAAAMPRDGRHAARLVVRSAYRELAVPVTAEAVFPVKGFAMFVGGAALALALVFGAVRYLLGLSLGEDSYQAMINKGTFLSMENASQAGNGNGLIFLLGLLGLGGLIYAFIRVLANLAKPKYAA